MHIYELVIDSEDQLSGIDAISVVESPAIEENFIALNSQEVKLAEVDKEKRLLMGAALIPNKPIYRRDGDKEYYIYFSKDTIVKASQLFLKGGNQSNSTLEHSEKLQGLTVVESWIIEDEVQDKSRKYGFSTPVGTWMVSVKVDNDQVWNDYVKTGKVKGFSIEGMFSEKLEMSKVKDFADYLESIHVELAEEFIKDVSSVELESYNDYPESATNAAKRALEWKEKNGSDCGTPVGWTRANQLAKREKISRETIARMASFARHLQNEDVPYSEGCGGIMVDAWGGRAGIEWAQNKLKEIDN